MLTSLEIAKILLKQKKERRTKTSGFDAAILGLGVGLNNKKSNK